VLYDKSASYPRTEDVTIYAAASEIPYEYTLIGQMIGDGGLFGSEDKLFEQMIKKAKQLGADAMIHPQFSREDELVVWPDNNVQSYTIKNSSAEMVRFKRSESGQPIPRNK